MSQCKTIVTLGHQCIYPAGHHGEHYAPMDGLDHSDEIRINVLREALAKAESRAERLAIENKQLLNAVLNQAGDNLCWMEDDDPLRVILDGKIQIPPRAEFLESCARYHSQISGERGELAGCKTIAQLEAEVIRLTIELQTLRKSFAQSITHHQDGDA